MTTIPMKPSTEAEFVDTSTSVEMPVIDMGIKEELPDSIVSRRRQHVISVLDTSSSMSGAKIAELNIAIQSLVRELADPKNRKGFRLSTVFFNSASTRDVLGECATTLNIAPATAGGGTNFEKALRETINSISDFNNLPNPEGWADRRPVVLFLSDGQSSASDATIDGLKEIAEVICVAFGSDADHGMLGKISSDGSVHKVGTKGGELRAFLADVGKTVSEAYQRNI